MRYHKFLETLKILTVPILLNILNQDQMIPLVRKMENKIQVERNLVLVLQAMKLAKDQRKKSLVQVIKMMNPVKVLLEMANLVEKHQVKMNNVAITLMKMIPVLVSKVPITQVPAELVEDHSKVKICN